MQESIVFLVRVQCRRKESSRSLSHLLMSFLLFSVHTINEKSNGQGEAKALDLPAKSFELAQPVVAPPLSHPGRITCLIFYARRTMR